jgi:hypothetical protein
MGAPALLLPYVVLPRPTLNRRVRALELELRLLQRAFAQELSEPSAIYRVMETTLIPAIVRVRACRKGLFSGQASFGRSASKTEWVYGFKVALVVDPEGVITAFGLAGAASDERPIGDALIASDHHAANTWPTRASRGSSGRGCGWRFTTCSLRPPQKQLPQGMVEGRSALDLWQTPDHIEGVIGQLKDFFDLERHRAKTLGGLLTRLAAKVVAYTCAQRINYSLGRPLRHLADLLI